MEQHINIKADRRIKVTPEKRQAIIRLRHEGKTFKEIAAETGMSFSSVRSYCARLIKEGEVEKRPSIAEAPPEVKPERNKEIVNLYRQGIKVKEIAERYGISDRSVYDVIRNEKYRNYQAEIQRLKKILDDHNIKYD